MQKCRGLLPEKEEDYIVFFRWMIGRRAAYLAAFLFILCGVVLIFLCSPLWQPDIGGGSFRRFAYDSTLLKVYHGKAEIINSDGTIAYIGKVKDGTANGKGTLYEQSGSVVYEGTFANGKYEGKGTLYAPGNRIIYQGNFWRNRILYEELVGKPVSKAAECYQGKRTVYSYEDCVCTAMREIEAVYYTVRDEDSLEDEWTVEGVYVLKPEFFGDEDVLVSWSDLEVYFGEEEYSGTMAVKFQDVAAVWVMREVRGEDAADGMVLMETFRQVYEVTAFHPEENLEIRTYKKDDFWYTFFGEKGNEGFSFYLIAAFVLWRQKSGN